MKKIFGFSRYEINEDGTVWDCERERFITSSIVNTIRDKSYFYINLLGDDGKRRSVRLHRLIAAAFIPNPDNLAQVDHQNSDSLDNRIENLRWVSVSENNQNRQVSKNGTSKFMGVSWDKTRNKWRSVIKKNDKNMYIGRYDSEDEAAKAYDVVAKELGYLHLNFKPKYKQGELEL